MDWILVAKIVGPALGVGILLGWWLAVQMNRKS
jgi:hypothetical protein